MSNSEDEKARPGKLRRHSRAGPLVGRILDGRYRVIEQIGRGGMGAVYRGEQASLDRPVALKILAGNFSPERAEEFRGRFNREAASTARLTHPNIITVFDHGVEVIDGEQHFFIAMELLDGATLGQTIARQGPLPFKRALHVSVQIAKALRVAHNGGIVHRDLKPGNIMLVKQGEDGDFVKVLDFGLAKVIDAQGGDPTLTKTGTFLGSPRYVSPEQVEGQPIDLRADIYSLGVVMYRMIDGRVPFEGDSPVEIMVKHLRESPPAFSRPNVPPSFRSLVFACLQKARDSRPTDMDAVLAILEKAQAEIEGEDLPATMPPTRRVDGNWGFHDENPSMASKAAPIDRWSPQHFMMGAALGLAVGAGIFGLLGAMSTPPPQVEITPPAVSAAPIELKLTSSPPAEVWLVRPDGNQRLGITPVETTVDLAISAPREVVFRRDGYRETRAPISITNSDDGQVLVVDVVLPPLPTDKADK